MDNSEIPNWSANDNEQPTIKSSGGAENGKDTTEPPKLNLIEKTLATIAEDCEIFRTLDKRVLGTFRIGAREVTADIDSDEFKEIVQSRVFKKYHTAAPESVFKQVIPLLRQRGLEMTPRTVFLRIATHDGRLYIDTGNDAGTIVEISADGWKLVLSGPIFIRPLRMGALPLPQKTTSLAKVLQRFFKLLNLRTREQKLTVLAFILCCFHPYGPYLGLAIKGGPGSLKSTDTELLKELIDPSVTQTESLPLRSDDFAVSCLFSRLLAYDNVSKIPNWLSDAFCRLLTGGGITARKFYSQSQQVVYDLKRPLVINGIGEFVVRPDLLDRILNLYLERVPKNKRRSKEAVLAEFDEIRPELFGAILDILVEIWKNKDSVHLEELPRMADALIWVTAAEPILGLEHGSFAKLFEENQQIAANIALESDPVADLLVQMITEQQPFSGTSQELLKRLENSARKNGMSPFLLPKSAASLSSRLNQLSAILAANGLEVIRPRRGKTRAFKIVKFASDSGNAVAGASSSKAPIDTDAVANDAVDTEIDSYSNTGESYDLNLEGNENI